MRSLEKKRAVKDLIAFGSHPDLLGAITAAPECADALVEALISANGFPYVECVEDASLVRFNAGHERESLQEVFVLDKRALRWEGSMSSIVEKTYLIVHAVENELSAATYLPPGMRQKAIQEVIRRTKADEALYSLIIRNW